MAKTSLLSDQWEPVGVAIIAYGKTSSVLTNCRKIQIERKLRQIVGRFSILIMQPTNKVD